MKDVQHHVRKLQKKVIQSARKEANNQSSTAVLNGTETSLVKFEGPVDRRKLYLLGRRGHGVPVLKRK